MRNRVLSQLFDSLPIPARDDAMSAARIATAPSYRVARDRDGSAVLLVPIEEKAPPVVPPIRLQNFEYEPHVSAVISEVGSPTSESGEYMVLRCRSGDPSLHSWFFELGQGLIQELGPRPSYLDADTAIRELVELFRSLVGAAQRTIFGLWAELLVILLARDVEVAAAAWHSDPGEEHDFCLGKERVEVKSTTKPIREHDVTLGQLVVPVGGIGFILSVMLTRTDAGRSVNDLLFETLERLPPKAEARRRLKSVVYATLGEHWRLAEDIRFDVGAARSSMRIFEAGRVPTVDPRTPPQVREVRFIVDLSDTESISAEAAAQRGTLPAALFGPTSTPAPGPR